MLSSWGTKWTNTCIPNCLLKIITAMLLSTLDVSTYDSLQWDLGTKEKRWMQKRREKELMKYKDEDRMKTRQTKVINLTTQTNSNNLNH